MTLAALLDAGVERAAVEDAVRSLGVAGVELKVETVRKAGIRAVRVQVEHPEQHVHRHFADVLRLIEAASGLTDKQKELASRIFRRLAEAEARVHGVAVEQVHFHEVGAVDSIVDVVGAAVGLDLLGVDEVVSSPVPTGGGMVRMAHGVCSVPAPATAELLKGVPLAQVSVEAELTTPTGAAILTTVAKAFGPLPAMTVEAVGYGAGTRDLPDRPNVLRLFVGRKEQPGEVDSVCVLETNLDDVPGEWVGYTTQRLLDAGALDVFCTPVFMKKNRPAVVLTVLCQPEDCERFECLLFEETGTFGVRKQVVQRVKRQREVVTVETPFGPVQGKVGRHVTGELFTPEFESCRSAAQKHNVPLREVYTAAVQAFGKELAVRLSRSDRLGGPRQPYSEAGSSAPPSALGEDSDTQEKHTDEPNG